MKEDFESQGRGWHIIFSYILKYKKEVVILSVLGLFSALANGAVPFIVGRFFDAIVAPNTLVHVAGFSLTLWVFLLSIWFLVQVVANGSDYVIDRLRRRLGTHIMSLFVTRAVSHLLTLPISFHKEHRHGDTWDRIMRAQNSLSRIVESVVIQVLPQLLSVAIGLIFAISIHPLLAVILIAGVIIYVATLIKVVSPIVELQKEGHKMWNEAYSDAYDALANYETVKQATAEVFEEKRLLHKFIDKAFGVWYKVEKIWSNINFYQRAVVVITQLSVFILSVIYIHQGILSLGDLIALNGYAAMIFAPFATLGYNWEAVQNGLVSIERAEHILEMSGENERNGLQKPVITGRIEFNNVSFGYDGKKKVLNDVSFTVEPGEVVAFVGESGVGKSTAVSLLSGYYFPTEGSVEIDGVPTKDIDLIHLRNSIAVVPQEVVLFNDSIGTNIRYGRPDASDEEIYIAAQKAHVDTFTSKFEEGYEQLVGERGVKLSVGEKQRVAIARAILRNPHILILDEPTSALDVKTEKAITESLNELMQGRTTFIIAHRLSTVRKANKILVFDKGKIVESGNHEELISREGGVYNKLYNLHIGLQD